MSVRRVLITGSRDWTDVETIRAFIESLPRDSVLIVGDARGADAIAKWTAVEYGIAAIRVFVADWKGHGHAAGPIRNQQMLDEGRPTEGHAFPMPSSRGTWDMVRRLRAAGVPTTIHQARRRKLAREG